MEIAPTLMIGGGKERSYIQEVTQWRTQDVFLVWV